MFYWSVSYSRQDNAILLRLTLLILIMVGNAVTPALSQNVTPRPTPFNTVEAVSPGPTPSRIWQANLPVKQIRDARFETIAGKRVVFSKHTPDAFFNRTNPPNAQLFYWEPGATRLLETGEEGVPGTIVADEEQGRFIIFIHNEQRGRDIDGDGIYQYILRLYHFETRQVLNLGAPARTSLELDAFSSFDVQHFEYELKNDLFVYSVSNQALNLAPQPNAQWRIVDIAEVLQLIDDSATPTPTPTPTPTQPAPEPTPTLTPTQTFSQRADINRDGIVDAMDLLLLYRHWHHEIEH